MFSDPLYRLRALFRRDSMEAELDQELRAHLERQVEKYVLSGMSPEAAQRRARIEFGGLDQVKEECRDAWGVRFIETLLQDIRFALRMLSKNPGFTAVAVIMLALGIGVTTTIFTAANDFLLRPLPFSNSDRLVMVKRYLKEFAQSGTNDPPTFKFWREHNHVFDDMAAWSVMTDHFNLTGAEGPDRVPAKQVSPTFFQVLGVKPILGRTFSATDDPPNGGNRVAVISHALWQTRYGGDTGILGKPMILNGDDYTIVGVLPAGFRFSTTPEDVWTTIPAPYLDGGHGGEFLNVIGLLKLGATLTQAQADVEALTTPWARQFPDWGRGDQWVAVESMRDRYARDLRPALLALLVAAGLVLLIACANLANLLLARATSRHKEIMMRRALVLSDVIDRNIV